LIQNSRYFFYGSPATYALVGLEDQHVWLVTDDLCSAQFILQAFKSKITLTIFDLTTFKNYTPNLIDNTICFNWQAPVNVLSTTAVLVKPDDNINSIVYIGTDVELKNIVEHDILLLPMERCQELQQQLMCIHNIFRDLDPTNLKISDRVKEIVAVNLELPQMELELYNLATELILEDTQTSIDILATLGRTYE
jgi:hypothetical protein